MADEKPVPYFTGPPFDCVIISASKEKWSTLLELLKLVPVYQPEDPQLKMWLDTLAFCEEETDS